MKKIAFILSTVFACNLAMAQSVTDILNMGQYNAAYSTARSAGMAGAFGSLGADAAAININPAGIGMYQTSEASITPMVQVSNYTSESLLGGKSYNDKANVTTFSLANAAAVINVYNGGKNDALNSFNIAVSYNRMNDYRSKQSSYSGYEGRSIGDMFAAQLYGVDPSYVYNEKDPMQPYRNSDTYYWGGILAYNTGLLYSLQDSEGTYSYQLAYLDEHGDYVGSLIPGDVVSPQLYKDIKGNISEFSFAMGGELWEKLYLGMTFSYQSFSYDQFNNYGEFADKTNVGDLAELNYRQWVSYRGNAFSFKFGATAEIAKGLRIAAAVHAPSIYTVDSEYQGDMQNFYFNDAKKYYQETPYYLQTMKLNTPTRFIASASYTIGQYAILSFDYERAWYNNMKVKDVSYNSSISNIYNSEIKETFRPSNILRAGIEARPYKNISVRGGYGYYQSPYLGQEYYGKTQNISACIGYRTSGFYVDLAYVNVSQNNMPAKYYSDPSFENSDGTAFGSLSTIYSKSQRHNILLTLGFRY